MQADHTRGEVHGCIVCGKLYEAYVVYDSRGKFVDLKVMTPGGKPVPDPVRPLVACTSHSDLDIKRAVERVFGKPRPPQEEE